MRVTSISFEPGRIPLARISSVWLVRPSRCSILALRDERALALPAVDPLLGLELLQHMADGGARDAELGAQLALGRERAPYRQAADQLEQRFAQAAETSADRVLV